MSASQMLNAPTYYTIWL